MKRETREFLEQEEAVAAAKSKAAKRAKRRQSTARMVLHVEKSIANLEANGNPNAAAAQRRFWHEAGYIKGPCPAGCRRHAKRTERTP